MKEINASTKKLTLRAWWDAVGTTQVHQMIGEVGTTIKYMRQLRYRIKRPGFDLAKAIIKWAEANTPGFVPDLDAMMEPVPKRQPNSGYTPIIQPSAAFLRAKAESERVGA